MESGGGGKVVKFVQLKQWFTNAICNFFIVSSIPATRT